MRQPPLQHLVIGVTLFCRDWAAGKWPIGGSAGRGGHGILKTWNPGNLGGAGGTYGGSVPAFQFSGAAPRGGLAGEGSAAATACRPSAAQVAHRCGRRQRRSVDMRCRGQSERLFSDEFHGLSNINAQFLGELKEGVFTMLSFNPCYRYPEGAA